METFDPNMEEMKKAMRQKAGKAGRWMKHTGSVIFLAVLLLVLGNGSFYNIEEQEQAVVTTFGVAKAVTDPGLHFKIPLIQRVKKVNTTIQGFALGYSQDSNEVMEADSLMITNDYNFVNVDFFIEYKVADPVKAVYASRDPVQILQIGRAHV